MSPHPGLFSFQEQRTMIAQHSTQTRPISLAPVSILGGRKSSALARTDEKAPNRNKPDGAKDAAYIVLGRDEAGKAHASWFNAADRPLAKTAAQAMGFAGLCVAADSVRELAGHLPQGRVFASGRAFVPFVRATLYQQLLEHLPEGSVEAARAAADPETPVPPAQPNEPSGSASYAEASGKEARPDWKTLKKGDIVLACEKPGEPWYTATVIEVKPNGLLVLRWRDYEDDPSIVRQRDHVGLLHPGCPV
jgi:hypothetical protein